MTLTYTPLLWLVPVLMGATYLAYRLREGRLSRPASWKANHALARRMEEAGTDPDDLTRAAVSQRLHDGLNRRVRRWLARAAQAIEALHEHNARVDRLTDEQANALQRRDENIAKLRSAKDRAAYLGHRMVGLLNTLLFIGDITIVSMAIQAADSGANLLVATAGALALAAALFVLGKSLGDSLKAVYGNSLGGIVVAVGIAAFSGGLYLLRLGHVEAWLILATAPAIGAAAVSLLGPSRLQSAVHRSEKAAAKTGKHREKAIKKRGKVAGRIEYLLTHAHLALDASGFAAMSIGQIAGLSNELIAYETVANQLGITLGPDFRHRPPATTNQVVDTVEQEKRSLPTDDAPQARSNGEGRHEVDLDAPDFVPDDVAAIAGEGPS